MSKKLVFALWIVFACALQPGRALAQTHDTHAVTIRIYDYASMSPTPIEQAQEYVTALYAQIDVHIVWAETLRPHARRGRVCERDPGELVINILPPAMSRRMDLTNVTLGHAAVTPFDGGTIAYVLFDRITDVASTSNASAADVLAVVMAHELGHLLLPSGSHSPTGLMRPTWNPNDFRAHNRQQWQFTSAQADAIRGLLTRRLGAGSLGSQIAGQ